MRLFGVLVTAMMAMPVLSINPFVIIFEEKSWCPVDTCPDTKIREAKTALFEHLNSILYPQRNLRESRELCGACVGLCEGLRCVDCYAYYGKCCKNVDSGCSPTRRELAIDSPNEGSSFEKDVVSKAIQANEVFNNYRKLTTDGTCSQEIHESNLFFMQYLLSKSVEDDPEWTSGCSCWLLASRHEGCYEACPEGYHRDPKNHEYCVLDTCDYNNLFECPENCQRKPDQDCYETIDNCDCPE